MCGIFAYIGTLINHPELLEAYLKTRNRGPDDNQLKCITRNLTFGFHRLSIMDTSYKGNQPLFHPSKPYSVICNGEIYNYKELINEYNLSPFSNSDCEVILYLYERFGIEGVLSRIDSESFSFCLYDGEQNKLLVARDRFGVRPLFVAHTINNEYIFSSETKSLIGLLDPTTDSITQFPPGCWREYDLTHKTSDDIESQQPQYNRYYNYEYPEIVDTTQNHRIQIKQKLTEAVNKRLMSDRPIGCLLSGGLDSSLISALVCKEFKRQGRGILNTFSIGITGSTDLMYAQKVADHIGSKHHTIEMSEEYFLNAIPEVIYHIESYDTTTVRASVGNYLIGKYIKENTDITVVFNGDGSDEQSGYLYLGNAPSEQDFKQECIRLLSEIHYFDVLRSDRSLSSNWSLETRTPFLDTDFVNYYMSIESKEKMYTNRIEKYLLRSAFDGDDLLPHDVLWRRKEAFSDGCSSKERSWHKVIQEHIEKHVSDEEYKANTYTHNPPQLKESYLYRKIFDSFYKGFANIIPHYWMPSWTDCIDPSARELDVYTDYMV
jgi:asparagine synthase (glutamine-hydrolysing)